MTNSSLDFAITKSQSESSIDRQIFELVEPLLYNEGRGKLLPLGLFWKSRFGKFKSEDVDETTSKDPCESISGNNLEDAAGYRRVCWKLEERGFVSETAVHICFPLSTPTHMILARKLLFMFPLLINI